MWVGWPILCAEVDSSLTPDLVEIPLMGIQICIQQTCSPLNKYPLVSQRVVHVSDKDFTRRGNRALHIYKLVGYKTKG